MRLFLYGTLLDPATLRARSGTPGLRPQNQPARLTGWQRVLLRHAAYPTLRRRRASNVQGEVVNVPARAFALLAAYEGPRYRLRRVVVRTANGKTAAHTWIAAAATRRPWET